MQNIRRRIEKLEILAAPLLRARQKRANGALEHLSVEDMELLISAFGADREGRMLTEFEAAARQAYVSALEEECWQARLRRPTGLERIPDTDVIYHAIIILTGRPLPSEGVQLVRAGWLAREQGRVPTEPQLAAMQIVESEWKRLYQLASGPSQAEPERLHPPEAPAEEGDQCRK
jgi:hypothetical protein